MARNVAGLDREAPLEGAAEGMRPRRARRWSNPNWDEGMARYAVEAARTQLGGGEAPPEEAAAAPQRRQRGTNMDPGNVMGSSGRQERTVNGRTYLMDGGWMVDKEALAPYGYDPDAAPPEVVEANRVERAQLRNMAARGNKQAAWRANSAAAQQFSQQFGGVPYFAGVQGLRKAREMGLNTEALVDDEGGDLALYLLNNQISLAQKPDGSWGFINTGHDPRDPSAQWVGAATGAGGVASGLNWENVSGVPSTDRQAPTTNRQAPPPVTPGSEETRVINGITYRRQPDGSWVAVGPATSPSSPPIPAPSPAPNQLPPVPPPAPTGPQAVPAGTSRVGGMGRTITPPPTSVLGAPKAPSNPMQQSVSSYLQTPKPGQFGANSQLKLPSIKPGGLGAGLKPPKPIGSF